MQTPTIWSKGGRVGDRPWAADCEAFNGRFSWPTYIEWLRGMAPHAATCLFAVVPDVIGNAAETLGQYDSFAAEMADWPLAYVAQDGAEGLPFPKCNAVFIGGTTEWKMSPEALFCIDRARDAGLWVHVGRVNTAKRIRHFMIAQVDSVDGTALKHGENVNGRIIDGALLQEALP